MLKCKCSGTGEQGGDAERRRKGTEGEAQKRPAELHARNPPVSRSSKPRGPGRPCGRGLISAHAIGISRLQLANLQICICPRSPSDPSTQDRLRSTALVCLPRQDIYPGHSIFSGFPGRCKDFLEFPSDVPGGEIPVFKVFGSWNGNPWLLGVF